jgi:hypothetical protein
MSLLRIFLPSDRRRLHRTKGDPRLDGLLSDGRRCAVQESRRIVYCHFFPRALAELNKLTDSPPLPPTVISRHAL